MIPYVKIWEFELGYSFTDMYGYQPMNIPGMPHKSTQDCKIKDPP